MTLTEILVVKLGTRLGKILLKSYLRDPAEAIGDDLLEVAKGRIESFLDRQEAKRQFERIGERIAAQLEPLFEHEFQRDQVSVEAVIFQLSGTLDGKISAEFFLGRDLDPAKLQAELKHLHPLPGGQFSNSEEELYDRALGEIVRYVVEIAAKLPRFEVTQVKESLQRLSRLEDMVGETAKSVKRIEEWVALQASDSESRQYELDYRLAIGRNLDYLELFGADLAPESKRQSLSVAYVSLSLDTTSGSRDQDAVPVPVGTVLSSLDEETGRLLIRGEAGSGKSTLFRWTAIQAAQGLFYSLKNLSSHDFLHICEGFSGSMAEGRLFLEGRSGGWLTRIVEKWPALRAGSAGLPSESKEAGGLPMWLFKLPFLLRLRDCKGGKLPSPEHFPTMLAKEIGSPPVAWVRSVLLAGRGLLLIDGIDEIPNLHRETVRREIEAIVNAYPKNLFLVSSRPEAVPPDWLSPLGFREARVNPMSELDRSRFIDKWHEAVAIELGRLGKPAADLPRLAAELKQQLPENPPVARLATNPLLCAMICALHRDRGQRLPESQSELCESLCHVLLHRRERESGLDLSEFPEPYRSLSYPQKRIIVQEIAHSMVLNGESTITTERAQEKVGEALRSLAGQSADNAEVVCSTLVERSGMLRETKPGHLDFIHNTFKEYLAGERFASSGDAGILAEHALDSTWQRVVLFAVATTRRDFAEEVIRRLLVRAAEAGKTPESRGYQLLALQARGGSLFVSRQIEKELDEIASKYLPPKSIADAEALARAGEMAVPFLKFKRALRAREAAACVRALRLIGTPRARALLEGYLEDRRASVVSELCQAVNPLSLKAIQEQLLEGKSLSAGVRSQISDLSPLSGLSGLRVLDLTGAAVSDVSALSGLSGLQELYLPGTAVSDVSALSGLSGLRVLALSGTAVSDVSALSGLSGLRVLDLGGTVVSDVSALSGLSGLETLFLSGTRVSDVSALSRLSGLQNLDLFGTPVSDVSALSGLSGLRVALSRTAVSDVSALSGLRIPEIFRKEFLRS
ncbi:MAG: NACHT domain-containing protein [Acidobacteria bacterium]|nr:NACHT domain-containing protein [Acidobacteriota bacterium]